MADLVIFVALFYLVILYNYFVQNLDHQLYQSCQDASNLTLPTDLSNKYPVLIEMTLFQ